MLYVAFVSTFVAALCTVVALQHLLFRRRRLHAILRERDPGEQRATVVQEIGWAERWERDAKQADLPWTFRTYLLIGGAGVGVGLLLTVWLGSTAHMAVAAVALAAPLAIVKYRQRIRAEQFSEQLPPALTLMANTIRAGGTLLQAAKAVARQMPDPMQTEFTRVEHALGLQVPPPVALDHVRQRIGSSEFTAVVVACRVAGQAGADLDVILEKIGREIVEDRQFRKAMWAASSEGRMSAKVVTAIPFVMGGLFYWKQPHYFDPMLTSALGQMMLYGSFLAVGLGWLIIRKITDARNW